MISRITLAAVLFLMPLAGQVAIKRPLTNKLSVLPIRFEQSPLRRPLAQHARPFASISCLPPVRYPALLAHRKTPDHFPAAFLGQVDPDSFRPWLLRIVVNQARNHLTATRRRVALADRSAADVLTTQTEPSAEASMLASEQRAVLLCAQRTESFVKSS